MNLDTTITSRQRSIFQSALRWCDAVTISVITTSNDTYGAEPHANGSLEPLPSALKRLRSSVLSHQIIQCGICPFQVKDNAIEMRPFNVFIFPDEFSSSVHQNGMTFSCNMAHLQRLALNKFDFNHTFLNGMSYLTFQDEVAVRRFSDAQLKEALHQHQNKCRVVYQGKSIVPSNPRDEQFADVARATIAAFTRNNTLNDAIKEYELKLTHAKNLGNNLTVTASANNKELIMIAGNSFLRRLLYQVIMEFSGIQAYTIDGKNSRRKPVMVELALDSDNDSEQLEQERALHMETTAADKVNDAIGFRALIQLIVGSHKLVIGHEICADLLYLERVLSGQIPSSFDKFSNKLHHSFQRVLDTAAINRSSMSLQDKLLSRSKELPLLFSEGFERYKTAPDRLEAGFISTKIVTLFGHFLHENIIDKHVFSNTFMSNDINRIIITGIESVLILDDEQKAARQDLIVLEIQSFDSCRLKTVVSNIVPNPLVTLEQYGAVCAFLRLTAGNDSISVCSQLQRQCENIIVGDECVNVMSYTEYYAKALRLFPQHNKYKRTFEHIE